MKKIFLRNKQGIGFALLGLIFASISMISCNKDFENTLKGQSEQDSSNLDIGQRKMLVIVLDGAVGSEVRSIAPVNLSLMGDFSINSYDALSDFKGGEGMSDARGWTTLLTGVSPDKHGVTGADFTGNDLDDYPTFFTRLKELRPDLKTAAFVSSPALKDNLLADATEKESFNGDDAAVKNAVVAQLGSDDNVSLVLAEFSGIAKAGDAGAYEVSDPGYKNAIITTDGYIGEILTSMRNRKDFANENWLVIVTSDRGSDVASDPDAALDNAFKDERRNTLFFIYNPRFKSQSIVKPSGILPYIGTSPYYSGTESDNQRSTVPVDVGGTEYDMGTTGNYTIWCKVKIPPADNYNYTPIIGKRDGFTASPGWFIFLGASNWVVNIGPGFNNKQLSWSGDNVMDGQWHTLTVVIKQEGASRKVYSFMDGVKNKNSALDITGLDLDSPEPFTVGQLPNSGGNSSAALKNYFVTDIRLYDTDLTDDYIAENSCKTDVPAFDPYQNNLLGFWPSTSVSGDKTLPDLSGNNRDLVVQSYNGGSFNDVTARVCPPVTETVYKIVPNSIDLASQLYQWFGVLISKDWDLDGKSLVPQYIDLKN